jgi:hypothetical protein
LLFAAVSQAGAVVLVDYDDGLANGIHDTAVRDGGFESTTLTGSPNPDAIFSQVANWTNLGGPQTTQAVRNNLARTGSNNGTGIDDGSRIHGLDTGYTLSVGDVVSFSYFWQDAFNWFDTQDEVRFTIFTTVDNSILGALDQSDSVLSGLSTTNATYQEHSNSFAIGAPMDGKRLFISIGGVSGGGASTGFVAIDDVFVQAIPEPTSLALVGLAAGLAAFRRSRR